MTYVTCPTMRYHPAVVAQKAATMALLSEGRFTLGLGSGENLNEHTVGEGWPAVETRQEMLEEAVEVIRALFGGDLVTYRGEHYAVDAARLWDLPEEQVRIALAVSGEPQRGAVRAAGRRPDRGRAEGRADHRVERRRGREPDRATGRGPSGSSPSAGTPTRRPRSSARTSSSAGSAAAGTSTPTSRRPPGSPSASQFVTPDDVAESIPCGPDLDKIVEAVGAFWEAGFTDVAVVQVGDEGQDRFLEEAAGPLLEKLRSAAP